MTIAHDMTRTVDPSRVKSGFGWLRLEAASAGDSSKTNGRSRRTGAILDGRR
jgi:hypothetical protein